nr:hypothetical protein [Megavirus caiporensis]
MNCIPRLVFKHLTVLEVVQNEGVEISHIRKTLCSSRKLVVQKLEIDGLNAVMSTIDFQSGIANQELDHFIVDIIHGIGNSGNVFDVVEIGICANLLDQLQEYRINSGAGIDLGNYVGSGSHCFRHYH